MECKKCGIDLSGKEYKKVASWPFCLECFQALFARAEEEKKTPDAAPEAGAAEKPQQCLICEKELEEGAVRELLGMILCRQCYENLIKKPEIPPRTETGEREQEMAEMEKPPVMQVRVDFSTPVQCYGCGRQIPFIGSKQFDGHPYCPDCYHCLQEIIARKPKPFPTEYAAHRAEAEEVPAGAGEQAVGLVCQACRRPVLPANLKTVEGFEICLACLATDPETALEIARARHRSTLERIRKELL